MAQINDDILTQLATLSRIQCTEEEKEKLKGRINRVLGYIDLLNEVETEGVKPCYCVSENLVNVLREDVVDNSLSREDFLSQAPSHVGGMIRVPPVIHFATP